MSPPIPGCDQPACSSFGAILGPGGGGDRVVAQVLVQDGASADEKRRRHSQVSNLMTVPILSVRNLQVEFATRRSVTR